MSGAGDEREAPFDLITIGRISVDLYPEQSGVPLADVQTFAKSLGGSPTNVAVAAARHGRRAAVITRVGDDGFGPYIRAALRRFGVDDRFVGIDSALRTPVVFCELFPPDRFPLLFYREPSAPDINLRPDALDLDVIRRSRLFWTTGTGLCAEPSRSATLGALRARAAAGPTIHDLDYRAEFWTSREDVVRCQRLALEHATIAIGNRDEAAIVVGEGEPDALAQRLLELGLDMAVVKLGGDGVVIAWAAGIERVPAVPVEVVNGLGAGDAFGGAFCHGLLAGWDPVRTVRFASAAGAHVAARLACADAMPTEDEVNALMVRAARSGGAGRHGR